MLSPQTVRVWKEITDDSNTFYFHATCLSVQSKGTEIQSLTAEVRRGPYVI
jgi:hypothetical protein